MKPLSNPEESWEPPASSVDVEASAVVARIGGDVEDWEVLGGGHANTTVRVGNDRVLRIYRRDVDSLRKEAALLGRDWEHLRTPGIEEVGEDFLVLGFVPHERLRGSRAHGAALGRALAEIHRRRFESGGFLDATSEHLAEPFENPLAALRQHVSSQTDVPEILRDGVIARLDAHRPTLETLCARPALLHGDFKVSNLHWCSDEGLPLVLDWEFAWSGPPLMDVGQLMRWAPPTGFRDAFAEAYRAAGGELPEDWRRWAELLDTINLVGLMDGAPTDSRRFRDVRARLQRTLER